MPKVAQEVPCKEDVGHLYIPKCISTRCRQKPNCQGDQAVCSKMGEWKGRAGAWKDQMGWKKELRKLPADEEDFQAGALDENI